MAYEKQNFLDGQIITADHLNHIENGIIAAQNPRNLLDNSDFRNPVNQRGASSYTGNVYTIDRWALWWDGTTNGKLTINDDGITVTQWLFQNLENVDPDKEYTFAVSTANGLHVVSGKPSESATDGVISIVVNGYVQVNVHNGGKLYWAALYEGVYTADTLPPYVPKGYGAELTECQRYYQKYNTVGLTCRNNGYATALLPVVMRVTPTISVGTRLLFTSSYTDVAADYPSVNLQADPNLIYFTNNFYTGFATLTCSNVQLSADL